MQRTKIFGPPGTGKTTRLLTIMEQELEAGVPPERLAYLTFTVAARQEAKDRAAKRFGFTQAQLKWFRTLHSVAYELLGVGQAALVTGDGKAITEFGDLYGYEFTNGLRFSDEGLPSFGLGKGDRLMAFDHFRRHRMEPWQQAFKKWVDNDDKFRFEVQRFCEGYEKWKAADGWVDFTDLLERGSAPLPCDVVIVDEAQDLSPLQWKAFWVFAQNAQRVYMGGDDDQAIYEWAGASPEVFLGQAADVVHVLPKSYRCPRRVTERAQRVIQPVRVRQQKDWQARDVDGTVSETLYIDQVKLPETGSVLYLYRNHKYAQDVCQHLRAEGEPYQLGHVPSIRATTAAAIITWEDLRKGKLVETEGLEQVFAHASMQRISQTSRDRARQLTQDKVTARDLVGTGWPEKIFTLAWFDVMDRLKDEEFYLRKVVQKYGRAGLRKESRIRLSTIHGVKGAEADHVVLITDMSKLVLKGAETDPDAERRVWYVGLTRARETLTLVGMDNMLL